MANEARNTLIILGLAVLFCVGAFLVAREVATRRVNASMPRVIINQDGGLQAPRLQLRGNVE